VTNDHLVRGYLEKARARLKTLPVLLAEGDHSDVIRESQEIVELLLKALLRHAGVEPPKWHDVGECLQAHALRIPSLAPADLVRLVAVSSRLGGERSIAFYGDETGGTDFGELYSEEDAREAIAYAGWVLDVVARACSGGGTGS